jgi:hypothetical protein
MLGAVLLGVLALSGSDGPLWWSEMPPRAGRPYVAMSYTGAGSFGCGGSIGPQPVRASLYRLGSTTVCILHVPRGSAGKRLLVRFDVELREGARVTIGSGAISPKLIRP